MHMRRWQLIKNERGKVKQNKKNLFNISKKRKSLGHSNEKGGNQIQWISMRFRSAIQCNPMQSNAIQCNPMQSNIMFMYCDQKLVYVSWLMWCERSEQIHIQITNICKNQYFLICIPCKEETQKARLCKSIITSKIQNVEVKQAKGIHSFIAYKNIISSWWWY